MFNLSLFSPVMSFSLKAFKKNFWFLQLLTLKVLALSLAFGVAVGLVVALVTLLFTSLGLISMIAQSSAEYQETVGFHAQNMFHFVPEMKWFAGWLIIVAAVSICLFLILKLVEYGMSLLANVLDIAENKEPRGFKRMSCAMSLIPVFFVSALFNGFCKMVPLTSPIFVAISIVLMWLFALRLYYAFLIVLDGRANGCQALLKSWKLTQAKLASLFLISLIIVTPSVINFLFQLQIIGNYSLSLYFFLLCVFNPLYLLIIARTYVTLKGQ